MRGVETRFSYEQIAESFVGGGRKLPSGKSCDSRVWRRRVQGVSVEQFEVASLFCGRFAGFVSEHGASTCVRFAGRLRIVDDEEMERLEDRQTTGVA